MTDHKHIFLSYSRNDLEAAANMRAQLERRGLSVFKDDASIREGDLWLNRLQDAVGACSGFVVLVGRDGVRRWIGAETQTALSRHFGPRDEAERLPIFPILLGDTAPESLPAFLRLFQATSWNGSDPLPERLLAQIRDRTIVASEGAVFEGCPFVGLNAFKIDQARLFFGRQKETLDALACFDTRPGSPTVRWLEINGNSGSGKSSLMNAGLRPLVDQGWLWPRTRFERWRPIGPMMPGEHPVGMLAEALARFSRQVLKEPVEMAAVRPLLEAGNRGLADWLRGRKQEDAAFLLAIDQFEDLPRLVSVRNRLGKPWTLPPIGEDGLREIIDGPAGLARLDVSEVRDAMVAEARDEAGALPLVENALYWLWDHREQRERSVCLSGQRYHDEGGIAGILSRRADGLLQPLTSEQKDRALSLLLRLVKVDPEGRRHTRRRMSLDAAIELAGGGGRGRGLVDRLAGRRARDGAPASGPLRLITVTEETAGRDTSGGGVRWVNLIHETLIRSKGADARGDPRPYWATLWSYIEQHKAEAVSLEADRLLALKLAWQIEEAAKNWAQADRNDDLRWSEERIQDALRESARIGAPPGDLLDSDFARVFLGPADPEEIATLLALGKDSDATAGSGRYGDPWRLPLRHQARTNLGDRLACLGDTRPGVGVREDGTPNIDWVAVPGGEVELEGETGRAPVAPFHMARYQVTNAEFQAFAETADGYRTPDWWEDMPADASNGPENPKWTAPNRPRETVSWYEAVAFCNWLSDRLGFAVRLPTEHEWQQAATGGNQGNIYPWGPEWDAERCNTRESGLKRTVAVGLYPAGASLQGVRDLAGNVREWCLSNYDNPLDTIVDASGASRVLRGGSWNAHRDNARAGDRNYFRPSNRLDYYGFRVVCSSPIR